MSDAPRLTRRAALAAGLGIAGLALTSMIQLSRRPGPPEPSRRGADPTAPPTGGGSARRPLRLGWSPWADAEVISLMAKQLIETHLDWPV